jgi:cysteine desulfuration protein SufE
MEIEDRQQKIVEDFETLTDWQDRYRRIIEIGRELPEFPEEHRVEDNLVKGCQNRVWLHAELDDDRVRFYADSEAMIVRGLVALLLEVYSDAPPGDIVTAQPTFIRDLELGQNLSQNRSNGLASMIKQMKMYALAFQTLQQRQNA